MITIPQTEATVGFVAPVFFDSSERLRERIVDCTREELIELAFFQQGMLEKFQGVTEGINLELENFLGYHEPLHIPDNRPSGP